jgi:hypothetical protein
MPELKAIALFAVTAVALAGMAIIVFAPRPA